MTNYNNPNYFIASDGALWFGPTNPEENLHYSKFAGSLDPEGNPIWVLSRTDPPADAVRATHPHAQGRAEAAVVEVWTLDGIPSGRLFQARLIKNIVRQQWPKLASVLDALCLEGARAAVDAAAKERGE